MDHWTFWAVLALGPIVGFGLGWNLCNLRHGRRSVILTFNGTMVQNPEEYAREVKAALEEVMAARP